MDNKPLPTSSRILIIHLTDMQNTNQRYRNKAMTLMESWGQLPHLIRTGQATIRLELEGPGTPKAYAIDLSGARRDQVDLRKDGDSWTLTVDTARGVMAYEIVRGGGQ